MVMWYFPTLHPSNKEKKRKEILNNDLAILPSHDNLYVDRNMEEDILRVVSNIFHWLLVDEY